MITMTNALDRMQQAAGSEQQVHSVRGSPFNPGMAKTLVSGPV
jgi:hypothetical protein